MADRLYLNDLEAYRNAPEGQRKRIYNIAGNYFDFEKAKDDYIQKKLKEFVLLNAEKTSIITTYGYVSLYNQVCNFFNEFIPEITLEKNSREEVLANYKAYLLSQGKPLFHEYTLVHDNRKRVYSSHGYYYLNRFLKFAYREQEDENILYAGDFPHMKNNPANPVKYFNLGKIRQEQMRREVREAVIFSASCKSARTIKSELYATNIFSGYMGRKHPGIKSCSEIKREHISDYIVFLKLETGYKARTYCNLIGSLKVLLSDVAMLHGYGKTDDFFSPYEYMKRKQAIGRAYTKHELQRFNQGLKTMDGQMARCLMLHQLLGTRISDTLLLEQSCLQEKFGKPVVMVKQEKTGKAFEKPINDEIAKLVETSINHTIRKYGKTKYIFVSSKNPELPMSYGTLKYWAEEMIRVNDIRDDFGKPLFFGTHAFRRHYGKRLTELHVDDVTIAKLLGHSDLQSVDRYRKMGNKQIAEETRHFRNHMDGIIKEISAGWQDEKL